MKTTTFVTLLGVMLFTQSPCRAQIDQSEDGVSENQPIDATDTRRRQVETPEVVLQLKYNEGELNRIYLTQFRKDSKGWSPPVLAKRSLCADLCYAGLGGSSCGTSCPKMVPVGLKTALSNSNNTDIVYGEPRTEVCPVLCKNGLGEPLCSCGANEPEPVDWSAVCQTFCSVDSYVLRGCPACNEPVKEAVLLSSIRSLNTVEGWQSWCNVQCRQGQGGAACNCDRTPFQ